MAESVAQRRARRPRIAVTGKASRWAPGWWCSWLALAWAGGHALRATPDRPLPADIDALVIGGGDDIATDLYAASSTHDHHADRHRDAFELTAIRHAGANNLPILGICRGAQLLNVATGGTLYTDITHLRRRTSNRVNPLACKPIAIRPGSRLATFGGPRQTVNSLHHQAIDWLGRNLRVSARDADGFVQAVETTTPSFVVGVQWHPEYLCYRHAQRRLFTALVQAAGQRDRWPSEKPMN